MDESKQVGQLAVAAEGLPGTDPWLGSRPEAGGLGAGIAGGATPRGRSGRREADPEARLRDWLRDVDL